MVLELRPNCEYCDKDLAPDDLSARICSYECTFCASCAETELLGVCPNCGGNLTPRPIRPKTEWRTGLSIYRQPSSQRRVHLSQDHQKIRELSLKLKDVPANER
jgi:uncharacterized protein